MATRPCKARWVTLTSQTLCHVLSTTSGRTKVLLGRKLQGFGAGKVMGLGGHVEPGETEAEAAVREVYEESGVQIDPDYLSHRATITFRFPTKPKWDAVVTVFVGEQWTGNTTDSLEVSPAWYDIDQLPLDEMWDDERYWLPRVLHGERLTATITYDESCSKVTDAKIETSIRP